MDAFKKETIVYGGAFNPPTLAHEQIVQACVEYARDRNADVWILPSGNRLDKSIPASREQRLAYIAAMLAGVRTEGVETAVPTLELDRVVPVETYDTVTQLAQQFPDREMTWVFGADSTETMGQWKMGSWLLENMSKLVIERPGSTVNPLARRVTQLTVHTTDVSSTTVRARLEQGLPVDDLVPLEVAKLLGV
jgi:nicotinate-nucleotide adenylyltransferase